MGGVSKKFLQQKDTMLTVKKYLLLLMFASSITFTCEPEGYDGISWYLPPNNEEDSVEKEQNRYFDELTKKPVIDPKEITPLVLSAIAGSSRHTELLEKVLASKIDPNMQNPECLIPLYSAITHKNIKGLEILIKHNVDITKEHSTNDTPLTFALAHQDIDEKYEKIITLLLQHPEINKIINKKSQISTALPSRDTPLLTAVSRYIHSSNQSQRPRLENIIKLLVARGENPYITNHFNKDSITLLNNAGFSAFAKEIEKK